MGIVYRASPRDRSLAPFQELIREREESVSRRPLGIGLPETQQSQVCHLLCSGCSGFLPPLPGKEACQFLHFVRTDRSLSPARCKFSIGAQACQHGQRVLSFY